jgi:hypothetical protein
MAPGIHTRRPLAPISNPAARSTPWPIPLLPPPLLLLDRLCIAISLMLTLMG